MKTRLVPGTNGSAHSSWFDALTAGLAVKTAKPLVKRLAVWLELSSLLAAC